MNIARLLQYTKENQIYGSQLASLSFVAAYFKSDVLRKIAFVHAKDLKYDTLHDTLMKKPFGIMIILPQTTKLLNETIWQMVQDFLSRNSFQAAIYFAYETAEIMELYEELKKKADIIEESKNLCNIW